MSVIDNIKSFFGASTTVKESGQMTATEVGVLPGFTQIGASRKSQQAVLAAYDASPWFRGVVDKISWAAATTPFTLHAVNPEQGSRDYRKGRKFIKHAPLQNAENIDARKKVMKKLAAQGRLVEIEDHKFFDVIQKPNPMMTGVDLRYFTYACLSVIGEAFWATTFGKYGAPEELWPIPAHWVQETPSSKSKYYKIRMGNTLRHFSQEEIVHFKHPTLHNPYSRGSGMGQSLADELETDEYIAKFQKTFFLNRGKPDIIFSVKGKKTTGGSYSYPNQDSLKRSKRQFEQEYRGVNKVGGSFWTSGDIDIKTIDQKMIDLELTEQRKWIKDLAREVFGVPPEIMGNIENSNRATITAALTIMAMMTVDPQVNRLCAMLQKDFIPKFDERLCVWFVSSVPDDKEFQLQAMSAQPGMATRGEWRELQGLEDRGDFDNVHYVPLGTTPELGPTRTVEPIDDGFKKTIGTRPKGFTRKTLDPAKIEDVVSVIDDLEFEENVTPVIESVVERFGNEAAENLGIEFNMANPAVGSHLAQWGTEHVRGINETTRRRMRTQLMLGINEGESIDALAKRLRFAMDGLSKHRSVLIARTETTRSANFGKFSVFQESGIVPRKEWISTPGPRTRDTHASLNGTVIGVDDLFVTTGGDTALHPGGFSTVAENANCRCALAPVVVDVRRSADEIAAIYKAFEVKLSGAENDVRKAVSKTFDIQTEILIEALSGRLI